MLNSQPLDMCGSFFQCLSTQLSLFSHYYLEDLCSETWCFQNITLYILYIQWLCSKSCKTSVLSVSSNAFHTLSTDQVKYIYIYSLFLSVLNFPVFAQLKWPCENTESLVRKSFSFFFFIFLYHDIILFLRLEYHQIFRLCLKIYFFSYMMSCKAQFVIHILPLWLFTLISIWKIFALKPLIVHLNGLCNSVSIIQLLFYSPSLDLLLLVTEPAWILPPIWFPVGTRCPHTSGLPIIISIIIFNSKELFQLKLCIRQNSVLG